VRPHPIRREYNPSIRRAGQVNENKSLLLKNEAHDQHEVIVLGLHKRAVIRTESFSRRVKEKLG
jgi:predicted thioesterase